LASNSLLEGLVFGARAGKAALDDEPGPILREYRGNTEAKPRPTPQSALATAVTKRVKRLMWERVGIIRDREGLERAVSELDLIAQGNLGTGSRNFVTLARMIATAALWREESRGGHFRSDFPEPLDTWLVHSIQSQQAPITGIRTLAAA
jgi:L-aspartate oxidase